MFVDHHSAYGRGVLRGIARYANAMGPWTLVIPPNWYVPPYPGITDWRGDGVIAQVQSEPFANWLTHFRVPVIDVNGSMTGLPFPQVLPDNAAAGALAAGHLLERGYRHFAVVGDSHYRFSDERRDAFEAAVAAAGARCDYADVNDPALREWAARLPRPAGVFGCTDGWARRFMEACPLRVPDEAAVIGVDDDELETTLARPPLTSVALPVEEIGYRAARTLHAMLQRRTPVERVERIAPSGITARASTDADAADDPLVAAALRLMRETFAANASVQRFAAALGVSRRTLERRFREVRGRTVLEDLHRIRLARAERMLATTDVPVEQIGRLCGFRSPNRFAILFRRAYGTTPSAHRLATRRG